MPIFPVSLEPAFVLSRRPYSNSSLLIELFAVHSGRLAVIARGARAQAGKRGGHLQPFVPLEVAWNGRGEVKTLTQAEATALPLLQQGEVLFYGYYLNELLLRLLPRHDPSAELFVLYANSLAGLSREGGSEALLRRFEVDLLELLGYALNLHLTEAGEPVQAGLRYHYRLEQGASLAPAASAESLPGEALLALAGKLPWDSTLLTSARVLMRRVMRHYLGERPLQSRELFRAIYKRKD
ncbi:MAG: DNA repair protein RecO [Gammaproteobacteria bacterium]|nr:DNA repair protein RecO [Gammaproteobacteria bacterium]